MHIPAQFDGHLSAQGALICAGPTDEQFYGCTFDEPFAATVNQLVDAKHALDEAVARFVAEPPRAAGFPPLISDDVMAAVNADRARLARVDAFLAKNRGAA